MKGLSGTPSYAMRRERVGSGYENKGRLGSRMVKFKTFPMYAYEKSFEVYYKRPYAPYALDVKSPEKGEFK